MTGTLDIAAADVDENMATGFVRALGDPSLTA
jgi:hypothetical protein